MDPQVLTRLDADTATAVHDLLATAAAHDGADSFSEQFLLTLRAGEERAGVHHVVVPGADRAVAGYAQLDGEYAELAVHPAERRRGVGSALVTALEGLTADPHVWAHGDLDAAKGLAERHGYRRDRVLWQMRRTAGEPLPEVSLPDGVTLRSFVPGCDDDEFLRVNNAAFDWHPEQGGWTGAELAARQAEDWFDADGFLLATAPDGTLLGYHWTKVHPATGDEPAMGEVYVLGVDPAAHGRGLGRVLTLAGLHHLHDRGLDTVLLYVEADNGPAVRVYQRLGFVVHAANVNYAR
ncbi:Acetyl-CoA:Cys-GlcN-Ins acetyltransferase, mycothiol synthase MshD [Pseudonocardia sp. Ae168_Ps1]|uniref:mycothiol synthase n=1 Tax=unclassified Pseudonocardia TaxID=2619320 RepID=UPI00094B783A|nr:MULTISPECIES: mycothiol synthase [unclassified Pseudonocardia]OLL75334.1 Acetyl-CoA:Cys-GlcN-Ins acetyltransferase, mycothiol synthase MshD [Pseudonocardia sp. Ae150A_Ps1]OLL81329.1 Acetyl-CoA:Cys-GlcN-Ins acetyltransferase, mycothiol synthase MshD [Pseudonocardia sp. Ae168_Ps1]OLL84557.1 Acetyl-CoA:Cys-GlcN-Ins acetyltransferase, mycothiol synthase MshD [Pseudonocardia sp. Ae263_Ps1]OLL95423.1 Acetyl-CoA:Cys-GlcN-Ins acetyltransferase, mycothiol synthase MshD [Pseudonocardia sp. Ae356_Ps1]